MCPRFEQVQVYDILQNVTKLYYNVQKALEYLSLQKKNRRTLFNAIKDVNLCF